MVDWRIDFASLPGPDRTKLLYMHDVVRPASSGELAAVVYSVVEFRMGWEGGYFVLFTGPPENPRVLWHPAQLQCMGYLNSLQWIDRDRYVVLNAYMSKSRTRVELPFLFVDVDEQRLAFYPIVNSIIAHIDVTKAAWLIREHGRDVLHASHDGEHIDPRGLDWRSWNDLENLKNDYLKGRLGKAT
jgi:hypothetical protein